MDNYQILLQSEMEWNKGQCYLRCYTVCTGGWISGSFVGILGYADDLTLLSPTIDGLQEMVKTCEEYATEHNLSFSTHPEANRCKTKCLAFLKKDRQLKKITLCKNDLPWVNSARHLGCKIGSRIRGIGDDLMEKRAIYISIKWTSYHKSFTTPILWRWLRSTTYLTRHFMGHSYGTFSQMKQYD